MALDVKRRTYSDADIASALQAVDANRGYVGPTAEALGVPEKTLHNWTVGRGKRAVAARSALMGGNVDLGLADRYLDIAIAAQDRTLEALPKASAYQAALIGAISTDKRQLILGRPTSRTEQVKARYVEGDSLRSIASRVIDVPALPALTKPDRTPKVAGGQGRGSYLTQSAGLKGKTKAKKRSPSKRTRMLSENIPAGNLVSNPTESPIQGRITQNVPDPAG